MQYRRALDFVGDIKADIAVIRRNHNNPTFDWIVQNGDSYGATSWGSSDISEGDYRDRIVPADYDGDGKGDYAVVRRMPGGVNNSNLVWWIKNSSDGAIRSAAFGLTNYDQPIPGDYDGDGKADFAVMRNSGGSGYSTFYILQSTNNQYRVQTIATPYPICYATQGNFDGDNKADPTMYCHDGNTAGSPGYFMSVRSLDGVRTQTQWGAGRDQPIFGDFDGDGRTDHAIVRGADSVLSGMNIEWWIKGSTGVSYAVTFGRTVSPNSRHITAQADYDGDNKTDIAVYDTTQGLFWIIASTTNQVVTVKFGGFQAGNEGHSDKPIRLINNSFENAQ